MGQKLQNSSTSPSLLLHTLNPILRLAKCLGLFPIHLRKDGSSHHSWFSKENLYFILVISGATVSSYIYVPFLLGTVGFIYENGNVMDHAAQVVFLAGQWIAGVITWILIQFMAPGLSQFWNDLQTLGINFLNPENVNQNQLRRLSITVRIEFACFFIFVSTFACFYTAYSWGFLLEKYDNEVGVGLVKFVAGFCVTCMLMAAHLMHSWIFENFVQVLWIYCRAFQRTVPIQMKDFQMFKTFYHAYCNVESLARQLGTIYGVYLLLQIVLMMTSTLVNLYFVIYMGNTFKEAFFERLSPALMLFTYFGWLLVLGNYGEIFQTEASKALKVLVESAAFNLTPEANLQAIGLLANLSGRSVGITAASFVRINRRLVTKIIAAITTYMVFLIQFNAENSWDWMTPTRSHPPSLLTTTNAAPATIHNNFTTF